MSLTRQLTHGDTGKENLSCQQGSSQGSFSSDLQVHTRKSQKGAGLAPFWAVHSMQSGSLVKKPLCILWLKERHVRDNHPWPSHFHPTASQRKAEPEEIRLRLKKCAAIRKNVQYQNKALQWSSETPLTTFLSPLLILRFDPPWPLLLRKRNVWNSAFSLCKYISLW